MYESVLNLHSRPFASNRPKEQTCFGQSMQKALANARLCIERGNGPALIIGAPGVGKSSLLSVLGQQYESQFHIVTLSCSRVDGRLEFLQAVLFELQRPYRGMSEGELRLALLDFLRTDTTKPAGLLLMVDDGENLSVEVLDEIRVVSNFVQDGLPRTRLLIAGGFRLEETLTDVRLQSLNQRISVRCFLRNLTQSETSEYVRDQIKRAGGDFQKLFNEDSLRTIFELTDGVPRFINQLCDHALILCATHGRIGVDSPIIREAWSDLQCFPDFLCDNLQTNAMCPTESRSGGQSDWSIIEFGSLDDSPFIGNASGVQTPKAPDYSTPNQQNSDWQDSHWSESDDFHDSPSLTTDSQNHWGVKPLSESEHDATQKPWETSPQWGQHSTEKGPQASIQPSTPSSPYTAVNPFAEQFSEVEVVTTRYASQIAQCNRSSQHLTPNDLTCLESLAQNLDCDSDQRHFRDENVDFVTRAHESQDQQPSLQLSQHEAADLTRAQQLIPTPTSNQIEEEAESILKQLAKAFGETPDTYEQPIGVSHETHAGTTPFTARLASDSIAPVNSLNSVHVHQGKSSQSELQELENLKQVIEEQNKFSAQAFDRLVIQTNSQSHGTGWSIRPAETQPEIQSLAQSNANLNFSQATQSPIHQDDRDMLICQPSEDVEGLHLTQSQNRLPFPPTPVSTGRAERMDYEQLFDQLRNLPNT